MKENQYIDLNDVRGEAHFIAIKRKAHSYGINVSIYAPYRNIAEWSYLVVSLGHMSFAKYLPSEVGERMHPDDYISGIYDKLNGLPPCGGIGLRMALDTIRQMPGFSGMTMSSSRVAITFLVPQTVEFDLDEGEAIKAQPGWCPPSMEEDEPGD